MAGCFVLGAMTSPTLSEHISYVLCRPKQDAPRVEETVHINPGKYSSPPSKASSEKRIMTDVSQTVTSHSPVADATAVDLDEELDDFMHSRGRATKKVSAGVCAVLSCLLCWIVSLVYRRIVSKSLSKYDLPQYRAQNLSNHAPARYHLACRHKAISPSWMPP